MINCLFGTDGIRGKVNNYPITPHFCLNLSSVISKIQNKVLIGVDTRSSSKMLQHALISGFMSNGTDVLLCGCIPTSCVSFLSRRFSAIGIMISASHNFSHDNGFKFFDSNGIKFSTEKEAELSSLLQSNSGTLVKSNEIGKTVKAYDSLEIYKNFLLSKCKTSLSGFKIAISCSNGACFFAPEVIKKLGAQLFVTCNDPDGFNINMGEENFCSFVVHNEADIGIILDGDGDRVNVYDEFGEKVCGDHILAFLASNLLKSGELCSNNIVSNVMSTMSYEAYINKLGLQLIRTPVGDKNIIHSMKKNNSSFGGEQSGHIILNNLTGDGILSMLFILKYLKKNPGPTSKVLRCFDQNPQVFSNVKCVEIPRDFNDLTQKINHDLNSDSRFLVRKSGTEPVIRIMAESSDLEVAQSIVRKLELILLK